MTPAETLVELQRQRTLNVLVRMLNLHQDYPALTADELLKAAYSQLIDALKDQDVP